jgi:serine/threonine protein kinase
VAALGGLDHPNVVRATDAGEADGVAYLVMDLVDGVDLARVLRSRGRLRVADACEAARQAATGLAHLAGRGLVHRDVKPSNLMIDRGGVAKVLDLGLAAPGPTGGTAEPLTESGHVVGTYEYLAPEQADNARGVDARADVYALGCTLYHLLTGRPPYAGSRFATAPAKLLAHASAPVPDVRTSAPDVPPGLAEVVRRMMAKDPADRFSGPAAAAAALAPYCGGSDLRCLASAACDGAESAGTPTGTGPILLEPIGARGRRSRAVRAAGVLGLVMVLSRSAEVFSQADLSCSLPARGGRPWTP